MSNNKYVCMLDLLGFSDLIKNNSTEEIAGIYNQTVLKALFVVFSGNTPSVEYFIISDSIFLWTPDDSDESFYDITAMSTGLLAVATAMGIPLRGAISRGPLVIFDGNGHRNILGKALIKAYELEKNQQWSGCVIDPEINVDEIRDRNKEHPIMNPIFTDYITKYNVPAKKGYLADQYVLNWVAVTKLLFKDFKPEYITSQFSMHNKSIEAGDVFQKIENTFAFYRDYFPKTTS